jgi:LysR family transcriptional regulator, carnitine catabolism transcriptional activator
MEISFRQLRAFLLVAQQRSFARAAEALYVTPSGLSVLIRELENQLGFRLFDRTTRHVGLTNYGTELLAVVRESVEKIESTVSRLNRSAVEAQSTLSIGAPPLIAANVLPDAIKEFREHRPDLCIRVTDVGGEALTRLVQKGQLDMSIGGFFKPAPEIRRTPLFRFSLMVVRPDTDPALRRASTTWTALKGERLLALTPGSVVQDFIDKHLSRLKIKVVPQATFSYLDTLIAMVEAGEGVGIVPSFVIPACYQRKVAMSKLINPSVNLDFSRISLRGRRLPSGSEEFTSFLQGYIARWAGRAGIL